MKNSFQDIIFKLNEFWSNAGCAVMMPYDMQMGAGTFHPYSLLWALGPNELQVAYPQPSRRPSDGRFGDNPNRLYKFHQYQVLLKPAGPDILDMYFASLNAIGIDTKKHDIRLVKDNWKNPTVGAWGLGWEVWCDGMEITQFTYMQQVAGIDCELVPGEIAYGIERLAMYIQGVDNLFDIAWNNRGKIYSFKDLIKTYEYEMSSYCKNHTNIEYLIKSFEFAYHEGKKLAELGLAYPSYEEGIKASNIFNLLDSRGVLSTSDRANYISKIREIVRLAAIVFVNNS